MSPPAPGTGRRLSYIDWMRGLAILNIMGPSIAAAAGVWQWASDGLVVLKNAGVDRWNRWRAAA
jgi:hypothetical protein